MSVSPQQPYPNAEQVMNRARAFVNDAFQGGAGRILKDTAPFSVEYLNSALEELAQRIRNRGVITLEYDNYILTPLTALPAPNPAIQTYVGFNGYFDGTKLNKVPFLPGNCLQVLEVWERQTGSGLPFQPMKQARPLYSANQFDLLPCVGVSPGPHQSPRIHGNGRSPDPLHGFARGDRAGNGREPLVECDDPDSRERQCSRETGRLQLRARARCSSGRDNANGRGQVHEVNHQRLHATESAHEVPPAAIRPAEYRRREFAVVGSS